MAQPIVCDVCGALQADVMLSNMHDGSTQALCLACLAACGTALAQQMFDAQQPPDGAAAAAPGPDAAAGTDAAPTQATAPDGAGARA